MKQDGVPQSTIQDSLIFLSLNLLVHHIHYHLLEKKFLIVCMKVYLLSIFLLFDKYPPKFLFSRYKTNFCLEYIYLTQNGALYRPDNGNHMIHEFFYSSVDTNWNLQLQIIMNRVPNWFFLTVKSCRKWISGWVSDSVAKHWCYLHYSLIFHPTCCSWGKPLGVSRFEAAETGDLQALTLEGSSRLSTSLSFLFIQVYFALTSVVYS